MAEPSITHNSPLCLLLLNHMQMKAGGFKASRFNSADKRVDRSDSLFCFHGGKDRLQQLIHHMCHCFQFNFLFSQSALFLDECWDRHFVTFTVRRNYSWHGGNKLLFQLHKLHIKPRCQALTCRSELVLHHPDVLAELSLEFRWSLCMDRLIIPLYDLNPFTGNGSKCYGVTHGWIKTASHFCAYCCSLHS